MPDFHYQPIFERGPDDTPYRKLTSDGVSTVSVGGRELLTIDPDVLRFVAHTAFDDVSHLLRSAHLRQLRSIFDDPESSDNDRFVALELLRNANIAAGRVLPGCQDTGTAIVLGHKGENVFTGRDDAVALSQGIYDAYDQRNLRYSQMAPLDMFSEKNTGSNLPAQIEIYAEPGDEYELLFIAKGGGSANKSFLYQETKALLNPASPAGLRRGEDAVDRHRGLPAVSLGAGRGRTVRRVHAQDGEAGDHPLPGYAAGQRQRARSRVPRPRD